MGYSSSFVNSAPSTKNAWNESGAGRKARGKDTEDIIKTHSFLLERI